MDKETILRTVQELRSQAKKRKFSQSFDLIINLKQLNLKKNQGVDVFLRLPNGKGKKAKICALVDKEMTSNAQKIFDNTIQKDEFRSLDKKQIKTLAKEYDFFVAQVNIMPDVAKTFGRILGPKGKMPNPKSGCVVPPNANLQNVYDNLQKIVRLQTKNDLSVKILLGKEDMQDENIVENALTVYNTLLHELPQEKNNIKNAFLKLTMSKPIEVKK